MHDPGPNGRYVLREEPYHATHDTAVITWL